MKSQKFNERHRYLLNGEEHPRDCDCGECHDFIAFSKRLLYGKGITNRGIAVTPGIEITTRKKR
jgi:hypothetical protein